MDDLKGLLNRGYRYAFSLSHNQEIAKDLVQEACAQIHSHGGPWNVGYLFKAIKNKYIDQIRKSQKIKFESLEIQNEHDGYTEDLDGNHDLDFYLSKLRDEEREVIYLSIVEGFTAKEISKMISKPQGTILSLIHRGKEKLKAFIFKSGRVEK